jgi:hypothetical protein
MTAEAQGTRNRCFWIGAGTLLLGFAGIGGGAALAMNCNHLAGKIIGTVIGGAGICTAIAPLVYIGQASVKNEEESFTQFILRFPPFFS